MRQARKDALRLSFDRKLKLEFRGTKVIGDAGKHVVFAIDSSVKSTDGRQESFVCNGVGTKI
jgi:hypothetical protein